MTDQKRIHLEPAYVLHHRAYRNSSLIVELFTRHHGRVAVVARSARGPRSRYKGCLQPFSPLLASWTGRGELKTLGQVEPQAVAITLDGNNLLCGFYLNELLMRLVKHEDPYSAIFQHYQRMLLILQDNANVEVELRYFEKHLLDELGYGLPLRYEVESGREISANRYYRYLPLRGFIECDDIDSAHVIPGDLLLAFRQDTLQSSDDLSKIKKLIRFVLSQHLGTKPIASRELFS